MEKDRQIKECFQGGSEEEGLENETETQMDKRMALPGCRANLLIKRIPELGQMEKRTKRRPTRKK